MRLARRLNILGYNFYVAEREGLEDCGTTEVSKRLITLDENLSESVLLETFYHEVIHAMLELGGYDQQLGTLEEPLVQFLGMAITQFLSNNENLDVLLPATPSKKEEK